VTVDSGAQLLLTMPGDSRVHRMARGHAELRQEFTVQRGSWLEVLPELFIPHRGARFRQKTAVQVEEGGVALLFESIAPGRTASGEIFVYDEMHWSTDIFYRDRLVARERYTLHPGSGSTASLRQVYPEAYYASCYAIGLDFIRPELQLRILRLQTSTVWIGCSPIKFGGLVIKIVASGSIVLREALHLLRSLLYDAADRAVPSLRRIQPIG
jgi:urease accessory protein